MPVYNSLVENFILPAGDTLLNTSFIQELRTWRRLDQLSPSALAQLQQDKLSHLLQYASSFIPFYQTRSIRRDKDVREWLRHFPIMDKAAILGHLPELIKGDLRKLVCEKSSGSSGIQGEVYMTRKEQFAALAAQTHLWEWAGYRLGDPLLQLGMTLDRTRTKKLKDKILRTNYQQAYTINETEANCALQQFVGKNGFFGGYASGLYAYACLAERLGIEVNFNGVISWGDKMFEHYRRKIETVFSTKVFDIYGSTEGFVISGQCEFGNHHIMTPHVYVELLDEDGNEVREGEIGHVVVTRLDAFSMSLIRFRLGDLAVKAGSSERCPCGRPFPMLKKIIGRDTDIVKTRLGKLLIVHFFTGIFEHISEIEQFRIIQKNLDGITVEYIPRANFSNDVLIRIQQKILGYLQEPFQIEFTEVKYIPSTTSGKPQIIESFLSNKQELQA